MLGRALRRRCPSCGASGLFDGWMRLRARCEQCWLLTDRGEHDYFLGGVVVNFIVAELVIAVVVAAGILVMWPAPDWELLVWLGLGAAVVSVPAFYPLSRTVWLAIDLAVRPRAAGPG